MERVTRLSMSNEQSFRGHGAHPSRTGGWKCEPDGVQAYETNKKGGSVRKTPIPVGDERPISLRWEVCDARR